MFIFCHENLQTAPLNRESLYKTNSEDFVVSLTHNLAAYIKAKGWKYFFVIADIV